MATRLMLSLKKAAAEPMGPWSLATIQGTGGGAGPQDGTIRFASHVPSESHQVLEVTGLPDDGAVELESMSKEPRGSDFI